MDTNTEKTEATAPEAKPKKKIGREFVKKHGRKAKSNGDAIGKALETFIVRKAPDKEEKLTKVAADNSIDMTKYAERNYGMRRMILGNILRAINAGRDGKPATAVIIGDTTVPAGSVEKATPPSPTAPAGEVAE